MADKVGKPIEKVAERTTRTVITAVEHPKETIEGLEKSAVDMGRYLSMDVSDLTHGNIRKLMRDTAHQQNAIDRGISRATGVSVGVLKVIQDMEGAALLKAAGRIAENPRAALEQLKKDARAIAAAARTNAADIRSGNMAKLLRDVTKQQSSVMTATIRTEVQLAGLPVPKSVLNAGITYEQTMNKMLTGQGAAELIEAVAHGKTGTALLIATKDADVLQGNQLINATNSEIHKATGISTGVLNTVEQIAGALVGDGPGVVASDAAKVVAQKSVQVAERDAVEAGVKAASEAAAKRTAESVATRTAATGAERTAGGAAESGVERTAARTAERSAERTAETGARQTAETGARQAGRQATRDAGESGARLGTRELTSPGAREATEVIPQGIVRRRVEFFEGLSRPGARTAVEDGARTAVRTGAERTAETGARTAVEDAARTGARTAVGDTVKVAGKSGFDDMVKSRLTDAAEKAAKESIEKGLHPFAVREAVEAAVKKAGEEVATDTANYAKYATLAAKPGGVANVWKAVGTDAATAGGLAVWGAREAGSQAAFHAGEKAAADYVGRWLTVDGGHLAEVAEKASVHVTPTFVAKSLITYVAKKEATPALEASLDAVSKNYNNSNPNPNSNPNSGAATQ